MRELVDVDFPEAERIRVVLDNLLHPHRCRSLRRIPTGRSAPRAQERLEFHYTPKHASWLNMVEIEIGVLKANVSIAASKAPTGSLPRSTRLAVSAKPKRRSHQLDVLHRQGQNQVMARAYPDPSLKEP